MNVQKTLSSALILLAAATQAYGEIVVTPDLVGQVHALRGKGDVMGARLDAAVPDPNANFNFHWQGLVRHPDPHIAVLYATMSYPCNEGGGALVVFDIGWADVIDGARMRSNRLSPQQPVDSTRPREYDRAVNVIRFPGNWHPGGMQISGRYLAIGLDSSTDYGCAGTGSTAIYDISDPYNPVFRNTATDWGAGVIGFTQQSDGRYVLVEASGYGSNVPYFSQSDDAEPVFFGYYADWKPDDLIDEDPDHEAIWPTAENSSYVFQTLNLFQGDDYPGTPGRIESLYMIGLRNERQDGLGKDVLIVYGVDLNESTLTATIWQITQREFPNDSTGQFNAAASVWAAPDGELLVYKTPYHNTGPLGSFAFIEHSSHRGRFVGEAAADACTAHVQLYTGVDYADDNTTDYSIGVDAADFLYEDYANLLNLEPILLMNDSISSVTWTLPVGCACRLYNGLNFAGDYLELIGTGYAEYIANLADVSWTGGSGNPNNKISSIRFTGICPGRGYHVAPGPLVPTLQSVMPLILPTNLCSVVKLAPGDYPTGGATLTQPMTLHAVGGLVNLGNP